MGSKFAISVTRGQKCTCTGGEIVFQNVKVDMGALPRLEKERKQRRGKERENAAAAHTYKQRERSICAPFLGLWTFSFGLWMGAIIF